MVEAVVAEREEREETVETAEMAAETEARTVDTDTRACRYFGSRCLSRRLTSKLAWS